MTASVIIVTLNRPEYIQRCLTCLFAQTMVPDQIVVVDASANDLTLKIVTQFPSIIYLRNDDGYGRMTASRNIGLRVADSEIMVFVDDDAFVHSDWLANLIATYSCPSIGAVGGRALNNQPGEELLGVNEIGRLKTNGDLTGHFAADPGEVVEVDHIMGCNMSFRRQVVAQLGGFREDYPGISGVREDSDMCLRVKALGYRILFNPAACVDHIGAPQATGKRFDTRYIYFSQRNHLTMLVRNFGPASGIVLRYLTYSLLQFAAEFVKRLGGAFIRPGVGVVGVAVGCISGLRLLIKTGRDPIRHDAEAESIRAALQPTAQEVTEHAFR